MRGKLKKLLRKAFKLLSSQFGGQENLNLVLSVWNVERDSRKSQWGAIVDESLGSKGGDKTSKRERGKKQGEREREKRSQKNGGQQELRRRQSDEALVYSLEKSYIHLPINDTLKNTYLFSSNTSSFADPSLLRAFVTTILRVCGVFGSQQSDVAGA